MRRSIIAPPTALAGAPLVLAQPPAAAPSILVCYITLIDGNGGAPEGGVNILIKRQPRHVGGRRRAPIFPGAHEATLQECPPTAR